MRGQSILSPLFVIALVGVLLAREDWTVALAVSCVAALVLWFWVREH